MPWPGVGGKEGVCTYWAPLASPLVCQGHGLEAPEKRGGRSSPAQVRTAQVMVHQGAPPSPTPRRPESFDALARGTVSEHSLASPPLQMLAVPGVSEPPRVRASAPSPGLAPEEDVSAAGQLPSAP